MFQWFALVDLICLWLFLDLAQRAPATDTLDVAPSASPLASTVEVEWG